MKQLVGTILMATVYFAALLIWKHTAGFEVAVLMGMSLIIGILFHPYKPKDE